MITSDVALLERWADQNDAEAFAELVARHSAMVYNTCRRILHNDADAQDIAQECFVGLIQMADRKKRIESSLGGWLHTVAVHRSLDRIKTDKRRCTRETRFANEIQNSGEVYDIDDVLDHVDEAIKELPEKLRTPIVLHFLEGQSHQAIADNFSIPRRTVTSRVAKGIDEVRKFLKQRGIPITTSALASIFTVEASHAAPATLIANLGKLALAEGAAASGAVVSSGLGAAGTLTTTGGIFTMKAFVTAAVVITAGIVAVSTIVSRNGASEKNLTETSQKPIAIAKEEPAEIESGEVQAATSKSSDNVAPSAALVAANQAEPPMVSGIVADYDGNPIENAKVSIRIIKDGRPNEPYETESSADGTFEFRELEPAERVFIRATKEGMVFTRSEEYVLPEEGLHDVVLSLYYGATVEGIIVDPMGRRIVDEDITARLHHSEEYLIAESGHSDSQGNFIISGLLPGTHSLTIIPAGVIRPDLEDLQIELKEGEHKTDVRVVYSGDAPVIAGHVVNEDGEPIENAFVQSLGGSNGIYVHTDENGYYRAVRLPRDSYIVIVSHDDYDHGRMTNVKVGREDVDFVLKAKGGVSGRVIDALSQQPVTSFEIMAREGISRELRWSDEDQFESVDNDEGHFSLDSVFPDGATIVVRAEGYMPSFEAINLENDDSSDEVILELTKGLILEGKVVNDSEKPVHEAYIFTGSPPAFGYWKNSYGVADFKRQLAQVAATKSDQDGSFRLDTLPPESCTITAYHIDYGKGEIEVAPVKPRTTNVKIVLTQGGGVKGKVLLDGQPVDKASVFLSAPGGLGTLFGRINTDAEGMFSFPEVSEEAVGVNVDLPVDTNAMISRRFSKNIEIIKGSTSEVIFDFLPATSSIEGRITILGEPAKGAQINLNIDVTGGREKSMLLNGEGGEYRIEQVPAGHASLSVSASAGPSGVQKKTVEFDIVEDETVSMDIDFPGKGIVTGTVSGLDSLEHGTVIALTGNVEVNDFSLEAMSELQPFIQGVSMISDGIYNINGLEPGTYTLLVTVSKSRSSESVKDTKWVTEIVTVHDDVELTRDFDLH